MPAVECLPTTSVFVLPESRELSRAADASLREATRRLALALPVELSVRLSLCDDVAPCATRQPDLGAVAACLARQRTNFEPSSQQHAMKDVAVQLTDCSGAHEAGSDGSTMCLTVDALSAEFAVFLPRVAASLAQRMLMCTDRSADDEALVNCGLRPSLPLALPGRCLALMKLHQLSDRFGRLRAEWYGLVTERQDWLSAIDKAQSTDRSLLWSSHAVATVQQASELLFKLTAIYTELRLAVQGPVYL